MNLENIGNRNKNVWDGEPEGVYIPVNEVAEIKCLSEDAEGFIAGAKFDQKLKPFYIGNNDIDIVQYGSDDTKTHRKIKHILGQKQADKVGRLLVSELYTVGQGGGQDFLLTSMILIEILWRLSMMKFTILDLDRVMGLVCNFSKIQIS